MLVVDSKSHSQQIEDMMKVMIKLGQFTDVTFICDDRKVVQAHRIILSSFSPVFRDIINSLTSSSSVVYLRGIRSIDLQPILEFIYLGKTRIEGNRIEEFLEVARSLQINDLHNSFPTEGDDEADKNSVPENEIKIEEGMENKTDSSAKTINENDLYSTVNKHDYVENEKIGAKNIPDTISNKDVGNYTIKNQNSPTSKQSRDYFCTECPFTTHNKDYLKKHKHNIHSGIKYQCKHCKKEFSQKPTLKNHIDGIHKGIKFACSYCSEEFPLKLKLKRHIASKHSGKNYTCDFCGYNLASEKIFRKHQLTCFTNNDDFTIVNSEQR